MANETSQTIPAAGKTIGLLAQFADADQLVAAARKTTDDGYRRVDAFSPFPIHGIDDALRSRKSILPWLVFWAGLSGCLLGIAMQFYMNGYEFPFIFSGYKFLISAKPFLGLPANIPVAFEMTILFASFTSFLSMLALNGLPRLSNPLFKNASFNRVTDDAFFLWIDANDPKFAEASTPDFLQSIGAQSVDPIHEEVESQIVPASLYAAGAVMAALALAPPLWIASAAGVSSTPRFSFWWDMDYQAKSKPQTTSPLFADGRAMRPPIEGTVARGSLQEDSGYYYGIQQGPIASLSRTPAMFVANEEVTDNPETPPEPDWTTEFPLPVSEQLAKRGQQRYDIYCSVCHGLAGEGDGLVARRALDLQQGTWVQPTNIHTEYVRLQPVGKIYNTISNGIRKMSGYKQQISVEDRWAIVLYIKSLQRSQRASATDLTDAARKKLGVSP